MWCVLTLRVLMCKYGHESYLPSGESITNGSNLGHRKWTFPPLAQAGKSAPGAGSYQTGKHPPHKGAFGGWATQTRLSFIHSMYF